MAQNNPSCLGGIGKTFFGSPAKSIVKDGKVPALPNPISVSQIPGSYPEYEDSRIVPSPPPPPVNTSDKSFEQDEEYANKNILLTKPIPQRFIDECATNFGKEIKTLVEKVQANSFNILWAFLMALIEIQIHQRRRILDCEKVPADCNFTKWEESWEATKPSRDPQGERMVKELIQLVRRSGKK